MEDRGRAQCVSAIIVFNGSFCPVHSGHVRAFDDTKLKLEANGKVRVVAGYFAVAPDHHVRKILSGRLEPWMKEAVRVDLCKAVAQDVGWPVSADVFESWRQCGQVMVENYHDAATEIFCVRLEAKKGGIRLEESADRFYSTNIRAEFAKLGCAPGVVDKLIHQGILGRAVGESLKHNFAALSHLSFTPSQSRVSQNFGYRPIATTSKTKDWGANSGLALCEGRNDFKARESEVLVVGICGASGSGKSHLAEALARVFGSPLRAISADSYFSWRKALCPYTGKRCNELPESVDLAALAQDLNWLVKKLRTASRVPSVTLRKSCLDTDQCGAALTGGRVVIIVEGFVLFASPEIIRVCGKLIWLDCDEATGRHRRLQRTNSTGKKIDEKDFECFYSHVFKHHLELRPLFLQAARENSCMEIDARQPAEVVLRMATEGLQAYMAKSHSNGAGVAAIGQEDAQPSIPPIVEQRCSELPDHIEAHLDQDEAASIVLQPARTRALARRRWRVKC